VLSAEFVRDLDIPAACAACARAGCRRTITKLLFCLSSLRSRAPALASDAGNRIVHATALRCVTIRVNCQVRPQPNLDPEIVWKMRSPSGVSGALDAGSSALRRASRCQIDLLENLQTVCGTMQLRSKLQQRAEARRLWMCGGAVSSIQAQLSLDHALAQAEEHATAGLMADRPRCGWEAVQDTGWHCEPQRDSVTVDSEFSICCV
jgi:hypothetical protein